MLSNKKTEKFFLKDMRTEELFFLKDMRTEGHVFGERQNSSGGLRPPQQSIIQTISNDVICIRHDAEGVSKLPI